MKRKMTLAKSFEPQDDTATPVGGNFTIMPVDFDITECEDIYAQRTALALSRKGDVQSVLLCPKTHSMQTDQERVFFHSIFFWTASLLGSEYNIEVTVAPFPLVDRWPGHLSDGDVVESTGSQEKHLSNEEKTRGKKKAFPFDEPSNNSEKFHKVRIARSLFPSQMTDAQLFVEHVSGGSLHSGDTAQTMVAVAPRQRGGMPSVSSNLSDPSDPTNSCNSSISTISTKSRSKNISNKPRYNNKRKRLCTSESLILDTPEPGTADPGQDEDASAAEDILPKDGSAESGLAESPSCDSRSEITTSCQSRSELTTSCGSRLEDPLVGAALAGIQSQVDSLEEILFSCPGENEDIQAVFSGPDERLISTFLDKRGERGVGSSRAEKHFRCSSGRYVHLLFNPREKTPIRNGIAGIAHSDAAYLVFPKSKQRLAVVRADPPPSQWIHSVKIVGQSHSSTATDSLSTTHSMFVSPVVPVPSVRVCRTAEGHQYQNLCEHCLGDGADGNGHRCKPLPGEWVEDEELLSLYEKRGIMIRKLPGSAHGNIKKNNTKNKKNNNKKINVENIKNIDTNNSVLRSTLFAMGRWFIDCKMSATEQHDLDQFDVFLVILTMGNAIPRDVTATDAIPTGSSNTTSSSLPRIVGYWAHAHHTPYSLSCMSVWPWVKEPGLGQVILDVSHALLAKQNRIGCPEMPYTSAGFSCIFRNVVQALKAALASKGGRVTWSDLARRTHRVVPHLQFAAALLQSPRDRMVGKESGLLCKGSALIGKAEFAVMLKAMEGSRGISARDFGPGSWYRSEDSEDYYACAASLIDPVREMFSDAAMQRKVTAKKVLDNA